jgi:hypothetical protein
VSFWIIVRSLFII